MEIVEAYPLALPPALKGAIEDLAQRRGITLEAFILAAVAEKLAASTADEHFANRAARSDPAAFDRFMNRAGGEPPRPGDEMPS